MKSLLYVFIIVTNVYCKYNCVLKYKNSKTREKYNFSVSLLNMWVHKPHIPQHPQNWILYHRTHIFGYSVWKECSAAHCDNEFIENKFQTDDDLTYCKLHNTCDEVF